MKCPACNKPYTFQTTILSDWIEYRCESCSSLFPVKKKPLIVKCAAKQPPIKRGEFIDGIY